MKQNSDKNEMQVKKIIFSDQSAESYFQQSVYGERSPSQHDLCNEQFDESNELETHVSTHQSLPKERPHPLCHLCGKLFQKPYNFYRHLRLHTAGAKVFKCDHCSYASNRKDCLRRHVIQKHKEFCDSVY